MRLGSSDRDSVNEPLKGFREVKEISGEWNRKCTITSKAVGTLSAHESIRTDEYRRVETLELQSSTNSCWFEFMWPV
jgi:hypothetical protein